MAGRECLQRAMLAKRNRSPSRLALVLLALAGWCSAAFAAPDAFSFIERSNVAAKSFVTSESKTMSGITDPLAVSVSGGNSAQYRIDSGAFTSSPGTIANGQSLTVRHISADAVATASITTVSVGPSFTTAFKSVTSSSDRTPDAFGFGGQGNVAPGAVIESATIFLAGFNASAPVTAGPGAEYRINDGTYTSAAGTLLPGQTLTLRHTSAARKLDYTKTWLKVGGVTGYFTTRTQGALDQAAYPLTPPPPPPPPPLSPRSLASYLHDLSPRLMNVTSANAALEHYSIPVSDGTILDSWVRRPPGIAGQPLVIVFSPYYGGGDPTLSALGDPSSTFASHLIPYGYAVGFVSVGGTGNSGGCFRDGGPIERKQLYDAAEYLSKRSWSNGAVATIGVSYDGTTANELFVAAPPSIKTVVPMEGISDYYRYTFHKGGIPRGDNTFFTTYYYPIVGLASAGLEGGVGPTEPVSYMTELQGEPCPEQLAIQQESVKTEVSADKTPFWRDRDAVELVNNSLTQKRPPMFFIEGLQDANVDPQMADGYLEAVKKTGVPLKVWFGQWVHAYPQGTTCAVKGACRGDFWDTALLAWFDQFLKGRNTGILDTPTVQVEGDDGVWRHEASWPPALKTTVLKMQAAGTLGTTAGSGTASYLDIGSNHYNESNTGRMVPYPQPPGVSVEFVSDMLTSPLRLSGQPRLVMAATADGTHANLIATLLERKADGTQRYLNFAALNLNHANSPYLGAADITGVPLTATLDFYPQENVIAAGSKLVLHLGGDIALTHTVTGNATNFLNYGMNLLPVAVGANVKLDLSKMQLELPVNASDVQEKLSWLQ